jgi:hypothetical protein
MEKWFSRKTPIFFAENWQKNTTICDHNIDLDAEAVDGKHGRVALRLGSGHGADDAGH